MILCDLPYGTTRCKWDAVIPFEPLWSEYKRVIKPGGAIVLTASQPFTSALVMSNLKWFRYEWIWHKSSATGFLDANRKPLKAHENVLVFYNKLPTYNPQKTHGHAPYKSIHRANRAEIYGNHGEAVTVNNGSRFPLSVIRKASAASTVHPTQKPVSLFEYLIRTYTNEGENVLDNCMGSGTTGVACANSGRNFIGIERDRAYFKLAQRRIRERV